MQITPESFVTVDYLIRLPSGQSFPPGGTPERLSFCMGHGIMPPDLEAALVGLTVGDSRTVHLTPEQAYGEVDEDLIVEIPKAEFDPNVELTPGVVFETEDEEGHPVYFILMEVKDDTVVVDFNHPLAGQALDVSVTVREVREATAADRAACTCEACSTGTGPA
ncbi:MAG: peptidylprolyl isomerase [Desulfobaccales bacterium]